MPAQGEQLLARFPLLPGSSVPNPDGPVAARRDEAVAVAAERQAPDLAAVLAQGESFLTARQVPHLDGAIVPAPGGQAPAVGAEGHAVGPAHLPTEGEPFLTGLA